MANNPGRSINDRVYYMYIIRVQQFSEAATMGNVI